MSRRPSILMAGIALLAALAAAGPAHAHSDATYAGGCLTSLHDSSIGSVTAVSGTCDGDFYWRATVRDDHAPSDGRCVTARVGGVLMATSCNSTGRTFTYRLPVSTHATVYVTICTTGATPNCVSEENYGF